MNNSPFMRIRKINDFDGYFISDTGIVFSGVGRGSKDKSKLCELFPLKPRAKRTGYLTVYMRQNSTNKRVDRFIHRLVADEYVYNPDPESKKVVNHINCIREDNHYTNLEWCTIKENNEHAERMNHIIRDSKGRFVKNSIYAL